MSATTGRSSPNAAARCHPTSTSATASRPNSPRQPEPGWRCYRCAASSRETSSGTADSSSGGRPVPAGARQTGFRPRPHLGGRQRRTGVADPLAPVMHAAGSGRLAEQEARPPPRLDSLSPAGQVPRVAESSVSRHVRRCLTCQKKHTLHSTVGLLDQKLSVVPSILRSWPAPLPLPRRSVLRSWRSGSTPRVCGPMGCCSPAPPGPTSMRSRPGNAWPTWPSPGSAGRSSRGRPSGEGPMVPRGANDRPALENPVVSDRYDGPGQVRTRRSRTRRRSSPGGTASGSRPRQPRRRLR